MTSTGPTLFGAPVAEPILIEWLEYPHPQVVMAATQALGALGTAHAVEALLPLTRGTFGPPDIRVAARDALQRVRSRLGPADAGRLALVDLDGDAGALSVVDDASGRVSQDDDVASREDASR